MRQILPRLHLTTSVSFQPLAKLQICSVVLIFLFVLLVPISEIQAAEEKSSTGTSDLVTGAACFILTPVYGAFKLVFAGTGAIVGGLTWVFTGGDEEAAQRVWDASLRGTYIISPDHLAGRKPVEFIGSTKS